MGLSAIARIECYKHYEAGAIHKEAVRELTNYSNPNWRSHDVHKNVYFERMDLNKRFEQWIYDFRDENNIVGRYIENSKNPKQETNAMCQCFLTVPGYIDILSREDQIEVLRHCYNFFKQEFPSVPVLEAVCHFDETSPHLQINFLPVVEREHKKRGKEKIFSTTLLMPGVDFFPQFQDRFYSYMQDHLQIDLERKKGSKIKHLSPKEYREITSEINALTEEKERLQAEVFEIKREISSYNQSLSELQKHLSLNNMMKKAQKKNRLELENFYFKYFLSLVFKALPVLELNFERFWTKHTKDSEPPIHSAEPKFRGYKDGANFGPMDWQIQRMIDKACGTNYAEEDIKRFYRQKREEIDR